MLRYMGIGKVRIEGDTMSIELEDYDRVFEAPRIRYPELRRGSKVHVTLSMHDSLILKAVGDAEVSL